MNERMNSIPDNPLAQRAHPPRKPYLLFGKPELTDYTFRTAPCRPRPSYLCGFASVKIRAENKFGGRMMSVIRTLACAGGQQKIDWVRTHMPLLLSWSGSLRKQSPFQACG